jgi:uncharacterized membrane protein YphA (DoxX/SURF4 family)
MVINFIAALAIAHIGAAYQVNYPAFTMLAAALFFMIHGPGRLSLDDSLERRP